MNRPQSPKRARRLAERLAGPVYGESVVGDLEERFREVCADRGAARARRWYWAQVVRSSVPLLTMDLSLRAGARAFGVMVGENAGVVLGGCAGVWTLRPLIRRVGPFAAMGWTAPAAAFVLGAVVAAAAVGWAAARVARGFTPVAAAMPVIVALGPVNFYSLYGPGAATLSLSLTWVVAIPTALTLGARRAAATG